jgi:hypothetical protein
MLWRNVAKILPNGNGTSPFVLPLLDECLTPESKNPFPSGGVPIPTRGKNS